MIEYYSIGLARYSCRVDFSVSRVPENKHGRSNLSGVFGTLTFFSHLHSLILPKNKTKK